MKKCLLTGSFDPPTRGHFRILQKALTLFDEAVLCVFVNRDKEAMFSPEARMRMLNAMVREAGLSGRVRVDADDGYVAEYARRHGIHFLVRGIRGASDADYEVSMAGFNREYTPGLETVLFPADPADREISSTQVRLFLQKGEIPAEALMPSTVALLKEIQEQ